MQLFLPLLVFWISIFWKKVNLLLLNDESFDVFTMFYFISVITKHKLVLLKWISSFGCYHPPADTSFITGPLPWIAVRGCRLPGPWSIFPSLYFMKLTAAPGLDSSCSNTCPATITINSNKLMVLSLLDWCWVINRSSELPAETGVESFV